MTPQKQFNIRKRIAKHGSNSIIVIPKLLQGDLPRGTIVELNIKVLEEVEEGKWNQYKIKKPLGINIYQNF